MAAGLIFSKTMAVATALLTLSALGGIIIMATYYQMEIDADPPIKPTVTPTERPIPTGPPPSLRLPKNMVPMEYNIFVKPNFRPTVDRNASQDFTFWGNSTVTLKCLNETRSIFMHSKHLVITKFHLRHGRSGGNLAVTLHVNESTVAETDFVEFRLEDEDLFFRMNETYSLFTEFSGRIRDDMSGLYRSEYKGEDTSVTRYLVATKLQAADARKVFPCFDEPEMKAKFQLTLIHRTGTSALSNWPQEASSGYEIEIAGEKWTVTEFIPTRNMSTYLLAFTVTNFKSKSHTRYERNTKVWARPEAIEDGQADYALDITHKIMEFYEKEFQIDYPVGKIDHIALPDHPVLAMENWGLITYRESAMLFLEGVSSSKDKEDIATVIAHELAHQWFGNLVTMKWWNEIWLNEGFASYMTYGALEYAEPTWAREDLFFLSELQRAFQADALASSHPLSSNEEAVQTLDEINELFNTISYSKGAAVLRMLRYHIGQRSFRDGIRMYLKARQYQNADQEDLWTYLQEDDGLVDVAAFMHTWTEQAGYPVVIVNTTSGKVSQERFLLNRTHHQEGSWHVPIPTLKQDGSIVLDRFILQNTVIRSELRSKDWVLVNFNCTGFYRVNYNVENWERLVNQLETDHHAIPLISRGQLIDDAFSLARAKYVDVTLALDTTKYLVNETQYIPWIMAIQNLEHALLIFDRSEVYGPMQAYLRKQISPLYYRFENYTLNSTVPESLMDQYAQEEAIAMACKVGLKDCINMAVTSFEKFRESKGNTSNETYRLQPNLKSSIYCHAIAAGGEEEWEYAWEMYRNSTIAAEQDKLLYGLSCTKHIWLLNRYLQYSLDPSKVRKMNAVRVINFIANNVAGQALAWDFVRAHWRHFNDEYGEEMISLPTLIYGVTRRFSTEYELQQLKQFQREHEDGGLGSAEWSVMQAIEQTEVNMRWVQDNKEILLDWFRTH